MSEKKYTLLLVVVLVGAVVLGLVVGMNVVRPRVNQVQLPDNPKTATVPMRLGEVDLEVEIRDDDVERSLGLSGRGALGENEGMLFVFDRVERPVFWMKDMLIDIDVIWIREGQVVGVEEDVPAPTQEDPIVRTMTPVEEVDSVLEVPAGFVQANEIRLGDKVEIQN